MSKRRPEEGATGCLVMLALVCGFLGIGNLYGWGEAFMTIAVICVAMLVFS